MPPRSRPSAPRTPVSRTPAQRRGDAAEELAARWLQERGWTIVARNWRTRGGELDIVARDGDTLVFVEVRSRGTGAWASAVESLPVSKQRRCVRAAEAWLRMHPLSPPQPCRFDLVAIDGPLQRPRIMHLPHAFDGTVLT